MFLFREGFSLESNKLSWIRTSNCEVPLTKSKKSSCEMGCLVCLLCEHTRKIRLRDSVASIG